MKVARAQRTKDLSAGLRKGSESKALGLRVDERKPAAEKALILGIAVAAKHEPTIGTALDVEQIQAAVGVLQGLHGHEDRLVHRLIPVLEPEAEREIRRDELVTEPDTPDMDIPKRRPLGGETELPDRRGDDLEDLAIRNRHLRQQTSRPVAEAIARGLHRSDELLDRRVRSHLDRKANRELTRLELRGPVIKIFLSGAEGGESRKIRDEKGHVNTYGCLYTIAKNTVLSTVLELIDIFQLVKSPFHC